MLKRPGIRTLVSATAFKSSDYVTMVAEVQADCPALKDIIFLGTLDWDRLHIEQADEEQLRARFAELSNTDPINIQ